MIAGKPLRSMLYIPADKPRALEKARGLGCDAIIFDLEDAVAPDAKRDARLSLQTALSGSYGGRLRLVRINALETEWGRDDIAALADMDCDAVLLPKVSRPTQIDAFLAIHDKLRPGLPVWAMMETAEGVINASEIAAHPRLEGFVMGTNDLTKELFVDVGPSRTEILTALSWSLLAARAHGCAIVDGVFNAFKDEQGLAVECEQGRAMGFDGKSLIHPSQIDVANRVFSPSAEALDLARRRIAAHEEALSKGTGVAVVDGKIVENLHVETDKALLARHEAIRKLEQELSA